MTNFPDTIKIHNKDNVLIATKDFFVGDAIESHRLVVRDDITSGDKIAYCDIPKDISIIKSGQRIGVANRNIHKGEHVHSHNLEAPNSVQRLAMEKINKVSDRKSQNLAHFNEFVRHDERVGARDYIGILTSVNCLAHQDRGGTQKSVDHGISNITDWLPSANQCKRQKVSTRHLVLGLQCGGSDACSGITVNPSLGHVVDLLVGQGGTAILSETPEIHGAEYLLLNLAVNSGVAKTLEERLQWWQAYVDKYGVELDNIPSPGNKKRWIDHNFRKIPWCSYQIRNITSDRRVPIRRAYRSRRSGIHGCTGL